MIKHTILVVLSYVLVLTIPSILYAHGVHGTVQSGGLVVTATYDTGEAVSYAKVSISAPDSELPFQSGRTDRNGRFCFFPDVKGDWEVVVNDEMGHRLEIDVPVNEHLTWKENQESRDTRETTFSRYEKALMGVCIVFGLFGIFSWSKARKG